MPRKKAAKISGFEGVDISYLGSRDEPAEERTVESRKKLRANLDAQIEEFLKNGGHIEEIPSNFRSNEPKKPSQEYGNQSL